jgi:hypothetical protein
MLFVNELGGSMSYAEHGSSLLSKARAFRVSPEVSSGLISTFFEALDCPRSLAADILFRNGEHEQLASLECDPLDYLTVAEFRSAYYATKFLSKFKDLVLGYDLDQVAMQKFDSFELLCKQTNARFRALERDSKFTGRVVGLHIAVQRKISRILGEFSFEEFVEMADWGPGATTLLTSRNARATNKFQCETGITRDLYALLPSDLLREVYPLWISHISDVGFPQFQIGNKVVTVPKDATANRVIAIEPGFNLWFQKAVGSMIQRRLLRCGIDLRYQDANQRLAYQASKDAVNATVDFSSASDSIASEVIREIFDCTSVSEGRPITLSKWFSVMDSCRSHYGRRGEDWVKWDKFSSMGNGFTFQLESLLFFAIAKCCQEEVHRHSSNAECGDVSVYGDDVIVPVDCLELFSVMCDFYGFRINQKKTHFSSAFRESCGSHFMSGVDTKPVYLKSHLSGALSFYRLANAVRRLAHRNLNKLGCDANFRPYFDSLLSWVPRQLQLRIPETLGDGGFISNWDESTPARATDVSPFRSSQIEGWVVRSLTEVSKTYQSEGVGLLLDRLWSGSIQERRNTVSLRGRTKLRFSRSLVQQWYNLGPWIS